MKKYYKNMLFLGMLAFAFMIPRVSMAQYHISYGKEGTSSGVGYVRPPSGYSMSHLQAFMPSLETLHFDGDVNQDDTMTTSWTTSYSYIVVTHKNSEQRANGTFNYIAVWKK